MMYGEHFVLPPHYGNSNSFPPRRPVPVSSSTRSLTRPAHGAPKGEEPTETTGTAATIVHMTTTSTFTRRDPPVGALTTIWTPPCGPDKWWTVPSYDLSDSQGIPATCVPPNWLCVITRNQPGHNYYYSPAICPSGFDPACPRSNSVQGPELLPGETAALCLQR